jgi:hypothetical protein
MQFTKAVSLFLALFRKRVSNARLCLHKQTAYQFSELFQSYISAL